MTTIALPPPLFVKWGCRRCGLKDGYAKCTIPVQGWNEDMMKELFVTLRKRLVQIHLRGQGCFARMDEFTIERGAPPEKQIVGLI